MADPLREPTEQHVSQADVDEAFASLNGTSKFYVAFGRGAFAFRYGPYDGPAAGAILRESLERRIAVTLVMQHEGPFDWDLAKEMGMRLVLEGDPGWKPAEPILQPVPKEEESGT